MQTPAPTAWLSTAETIGHVIAEDAIWHENRCNWIGGAVPQAGAGGVSNLTYRALGPDLYGGTAGIGLFLAELTATTGDGVLRRTAVGALRHAISRIDCLHPRAAGGLYAGRPGVAIALVRAAHALDHPELEAAARAVVLDLPAPTPRGEHDLMSGCAGAIVGLLALRHLLDAERLLDVAVLHGDALLEAALKSGATMSWPSPGSPGAPGLTGFSHGAAGIAVALFELAMAADEPRYRDAGEAALAYERDLFDPAVGNWPDLRVTSRSLTDEKAAFATYWCHGAPGIALSRLRVLELGAAPAALEDAELALAATQRGIADALASGLMYYSLCHGLAGNAEILIEGSKLIPSLAANGVAAATAGIDTYHARGVPWPLGVNGGANPALFPGLAGVGWFYLRLGDRTVPSVLLIRPDQDVRSIGERRLR